MEDAYTIETCRCLREGAYIAASCLELLEVRLRYGRTADHISESGSTESQRLRTVDKSRICCASGLADVTAGKIDFSNVNKEISLLVSTAKDSCTAMQCNAMQCNAMQWAYSAEQKQLLTDESICNVFQSRPKDHAC